MENPPVSLFASPSLEPEIFFSSSNTGFLFSTSVALVDSLEARLRERAACPNVYANRQGTRRGMEEPKH